MCGITLLWGSAITDAVHEASLAALAPRGPDAARRIVVAGAEGSSPHPFHVGFVRLQIQGSRAGAEQPFTLRDGRVLAINGEIFNADILRRQHGLAVPEGGSDCAVVAAMLDRSSGTSLADIVRELDGDFAAVLVDPASGRVECARDPYGVRPLVWGRSGGTGWEGIVSDVSAFPAGPTESREIPPGSVGSPPDGLTIWHQPPWLKIPRWRACLDGLAEGGAALRQALEESVRKRLATVYEVGVCLTGSLESELIATIAARWLARSGLPLHTYTAGSVDAAAAASIATRIGSIHHTSESDSLVGLIRSATPNVRVLLTGHGGRALFGVTAEDDATYEAAADRALRTVHEGNLATDERTFAVNSLELRAPLLDRQFVAVVRGLPTDAMRLSGRSLLRTACGDLLAARTAAQHSVQPE